MITDRRFLEPHPETLAWWVRRERCLRCVHVRESDDGSMRCAKSSGEVGTLHKRGGIYRRGKGILDFCIDVRTEAGKCGPDAKLFKSSGASDEVADPVHPLWRHWLALPRE